MDDNPEREVEAAAREMDATIQRMEREGERVARDIAGSRDEAAEMRRRTGARDAAGDWRDTDDQSGGEDPRGAGGDQPAEREDDEASRGGTRGG